MTTQFFNALGMLANRCTKSGNKKYVPLRTPQSLYVAMGAQNLYSYLADEGVDPVTCWTAKQAGNSMFYFSPPSIALIKDQVTLNLCFQGQGRGEAMINLEEIKDTTFYSLVSDDPFPQYRITVKDEAKQSISIPVRLFTVEDSVVDSIGTVGSLSFRSLGNGTGSGFSKLTDILELNQPRVLTFTGLTTSAGNYGTDYYATIEGYEGSYYLTPKFGQGIELSTFVGETFPMKVALRAISKQDKTFVERLNLDSVGASEDGRPPSMANPTTTPTTSTRTETKPPAETAGYSQGDPDFDDIPF